MGRRRSLRGRTGWHACARRAGARRPPPARRRAPHRPRARPGAVWRPAPAAQCHFMPQRCCGEAEHRRCPQPGDLSCHRIPGSLTSIVDRTGQAVATWVSGWLRSGPLTERHAGSQRPPRTPWDVSWRPGAARAAHAYSMAPSHRRDRAAGETRTRGSPGGAPWRARLRAWRPARPAAPPAAPSAPAASARRC